MYLFQWLCNALLRGMHYHLFSYNPTVLNKIYCSALIVSKARVSSCILWCVWLLSCVISLEWIFWKDSWVQEYELPVQLAIIILKKFLNSFKLAKPKPFCSPSQISPQNKNQEAKIISIFNENKFKILSHKY